MIVKDFKGFAGQHCETTATGSLLNHIGLEYSEPILFGLGEGLNYIFWNMKTMDFPFIGGRNKPDVLTRNICKNLNLDLKVDETASTRKAWQNVTKYLDNNIPVGLKLDSYYLEYFTSKIHFAGHYATIYGYDNEFGYLVDTEQQGKNVRAQLKNIAMARNAKGPMSSRNLSYTISRKGVLADLDKAVKNAIQNNACEYLNPPINNISFKGIYKTGTEVKKWFENSRHIERDFKLAARLMERGGTGGALFRNIYRDFLKESYELLQIAKIEESYCRFIEIADLWTKISHLFSKIGETRDINSVNLVSGLFIEISERERKAMELLAKL